MVGRVADSGVRFSPPSASRATASAGGTTRSTRLKRSCAPWLAPQPLWQLNTPPDRPRHTRYALRSTSHTLLPLFEAYLPNLVGLETCKLWRPVPWLESSARGMIASPLFVSPEEAVAHGTAIQAAILTDRKRISVGASEAGIIAHLEYER